MRRFRVWVYLGLIVLATNRLRADSPDFVTEVRPIFERHCYECHAGEKKTSGFRLDVKSEAFRGGESYGPSLVPGKPDESPLLQFVEATDEGERMPPEGEGLSADEIATLRKWIEAGAEWPEGVDRVELVDPRSHWSFQPLRESFEHDSIDEFIRAGLARNGMSLSAPADRTTWLRRVTLDLTGLPPTIEELDAFLADESDEAFERVVDRLLDSPRYGERWGQHWLDLVRYADTHGFEVNTERPHAWPYRDWVIKALNDDLPYDQFVRDQIAGDAFEADAATGFLVTASVLLPGQIGADAPSMRLARQDALDEIVNNIGQTFLGLSVGCARCHDHKFDPISQADYYSMQSLVAGVEYGDRPLRTPESLAREREANELEARLTAIEQALSRFEPLALTDGDQWNPPSSSLNEERFDGIEASFVRMTIHDANRHPTLGLIEPCVDEFEILTDEAEPRNVALATHGTRVSASGSRTSDLHRLEHVNDGVYGNSRSWMSDEAGRGVLEFTLPELTRISTIRWSRDRLGEFQDRTAIAYTIEVGPSPDSLTTIVDRPAPRVRVIATQNVDRFSAVTGSALRFTIRATNSLEPCIDELEVFDTAGVNVAAASLGAKVRSSGDQVAPGRHELRLIHDGVYGNSSSWMSNQVGAGEVTVEFPEPKMIERVVWGRDREGMFADRLATDYRIEVLDSTGTWRLVAGSMDRVPFDAPMETGASFRISLSGLEQEEAAEVRELLAEQSGLQSKVAMLRQSQLGFVGVFRTPDEIHRLHRGDPEQPRERVAPAIPRVLGMAELAQDADERSRRLFLAEWISDPANPLTARVMVNRIWQGHFGYGLVETASDFGFAGSKPTHPELLDWLAKRFIDIGWSMKRLHREIVLSQAYRQDSHWNRQAAQWDAEARWLWRFPTRRLEAEAIRDSMLAVSGELNLQMGGRGFDLFDQRGGLSGFQPVESFGPEGLRRMIYAHKVRREREAVFGAFDCPDAGQSTARRRESTTPIQALNLFNSRFTLERSEAFAKRVQNEIPDGMREQIRLAFQLALQREPSDVEFDEIEPIVAEQGLVPLCRALLNSNEFLFLP